MNFCCYRKRYCLGTYTYLAPHSPKLDEKAGGGFARSPTGAESTYLSSTLLPVHVKKLYADGQIGLSKEFESLATTLQSGDFQGTLKEAQRPENRPKNRLASCRFEFFTAIFSFGTAVEEKFAAV